MPIYPDAWNSGIIQADQCENPVNSDWAVNALAPLAADSINNGLIVRRFDDTVEEGVGFLLPIPTGAKQMRITMCTRAETVPGTAKKVGWKLYAREIPDDAAVPAWDAGTQWDDLDIPTNAHFQRDSEVRDLSALGYIDGMLYQFELTRVAPASDNLVGDWNLLQFMVEFLQ